MNVFLKSQGRKDKCISELVSLGDFIFLSGQIGLGQTLNAQMDHICRSMEEQLAQMDLALHHIVKVTIFLTDINQKSEVLEAYQQHFEAPFPACSIVEVSRLENNSQVMMEAFAINTLRYEKQLRQSSCQACQGC